MFSIRNQNSVFAPHSTFFSSWYLSFPLYRIWSNFPLLLLFMWTQESVNYTRTFEFPCNLLWEVKGLGSLMSHASFFSCLKDKYSVWREVITLDCFLSLILNFSCDFQHLKNKSFWMQSVLQNKNNHGPKVSKWLLTVSAEGSAGLGAKESQIHWRWRWIFLTMSMGTFMLQFQPPVALNYPVAFS